MYLKPTVLLLLGALLQTTTAAPVTPAEGSNPLEERKAPLRARLGGVCKNDPNSNTSLRFTFDWSKRTTTGYNYLPRGASSTILTSDCDGFYIDPGCRGTSVDGGRVWPSGQWTKINDLQEFTVKIIC
ncbi:hypothetical protein V8F20_008923 [Naviculisporaceae sp. PSN 640]